MNYKTEKQQGSVKFTFTVPADEWEAEINAAYVKTRNKYNIPGFRRGHAPRKFIENMYGAGVFFDEAFNTCANKSYSQALSENTDIVPVDEPKADIVNFGDKEFVFSLEVTVKPEVTLGEYKGLTVNKAEYPVTDKDVQEDIDRSLNAKSRMVEITDREARDGDTVTIDYSGSVDGVKFNGGTADNQELTLGSHSFIPGFEEQVVGMKIGEEKDINVKFPDDYHAEDLKGKDAVFAIKLHAIKFREVPELNDDFVKDTSKFENVADYRADVLKRLQENASRREDTENKNNLIDAIVEGSKVDIPDCMVESELEYMLEDFGYRLSYMYGGMKIDDYFKYTGSSREDFKKDRRDEAYKSVKTRLVVEELLKAEKTEPSKEDIDKRISQLAEVAGKTPEEYKASLNGGRMQSIENNAKVEKLLDDLCALNTFVAKKEEKSASKAAKPASATKTASKSTATKSAAKPAAKKTAAKTEEKKD